MKDEPSRIFVNMSQWTISRRSVHLLWILIVTVLVLVLPHVDLLEFHLGTAPIVVKDGEP